MGIPKHSDANRSGNENANLQKLRRVMVGLPLGMAGGEGLNQGLCVGFPVIRELINLERRFGYGFSIPCQVGL